MNVLLAAPLVTLVAVPAALALLAASVPARGRVLAPVLAAVGPLLTFTAAIGGLSQVTGDAPVSAGSLPWFIASERALSIAWSIDALTLVMLAVVGFVAICVVLFSTGYMSEEPGWPRYFALISLFVASMNLLVIASSLTTLFAGWELVGACSYLLIGFWYKKPSAARAAIKAFLTTRVGDVGLLIGIALLWAHAGTDGYAEVFAALGGLPASVVSVAAVGIAIGAMGKSAQFPLHAWLPDAMEGPTPVSALIHAATMVAAGVFAIARLWPLFESAPEARTLLLAVGTVSALGAALAATAQTDIKKVLAYSTISQLGFMFAALGAGAPVAAMFHLVTHAAFKALLFLGSGSVIHGSGTQDLREMGGLRRAMPITFTTWLVGAFALTGIFPFSGFFSKDALLEAVLHTSAPAAVTLFAASAATAFYAVRTTRLAFFGTPAEKPATVTAGHAATPGHAHESSLSMLAPLAALAVPAAVAGFAHSRVAELLGGHSGPLALGVSAAALALAVAGGLAGWFAASAPTATASPLAPLWLLLARGWNFDAFVGAAIVRPAIAVSRGLWAIGDRLIADGLAEGSAALARKAGRGFSRLQTGEGQAYATAIAVVFVFLLIASVWIGRW